MFVYYWYEFTTVSSHLLSSPFYSLPINSRNSDPGSHSRLFSPPTHYGPCLAFLSREDTVVVINCEILLLCLPIRPRAAYELQRLSLISIPDTEKNADCCFYTAVPGISINTLFLLMLA